MGIVALYSSLPESSADSVLLCRRLGLGIDEAAELMGLEPPAVEAGLSTARRALPYLDTGRRP
ncbi:sigma factor-like helix-turn-helix DNA-binding protein [Streptomyces sp. L500]|uniref:sigma factor-like helix-turn-helix DNA-binding protein n=1 Tax=Streptomyces abikoensis TaxID=97398 RepID=UPI0036BF0E5F